MKRSVLPVIAVFAIALGSSTWAADAAATTEAAKKAAQYLLAQQNEDGTFGKTKAAGMPGLVGLVVKGLASSPLKLREDNAAVAKAAKYIASKQLPSGAIAVPEFGLENYNTSVAIVALVALENPAYKDVLEKAKQYVLNCQLVEAQGYNKDEHTRAYGSFGYGNSKRGDLSNTGFSLDALKALGLKEDSPAWKNAVIFVKRCQDNDELNELEEMKGGDNTNGFVYLPGDSEFGTVTTRSGKKMPKPYGNMTYMAIKSLVYAGVSKDDPALKAAFQWVKNNYSVKHNPGGQGAQGYYYYALALAKAMAAAGVTELELADGRKVHWAKDLAEHLISLQTPDGSFVNKEDRWMEGDPVLTTSYALDALNICIGALK